MTAQNKATGPNLTMTMNRRRFTLLNGRLGVGTLVLPLLLLSAGLLAGACSSIDCSLNNLVYTQYQLMNSEGKVDTLADTLTVSTKRMEGSDSVLINRNVGTTEFSLPISYSQAQDVFFVELTDTITKRPTFDTITVNKEDRIHFESVDCTPSYFHTLQSVSSTHHRIDSVVIINHEVNYDTSKKHFRIYFNHAH